MPLPKPCKYCGKRIPNPTVSQKICEECQEKNRAIGIKKRSKKGWSSVISRLK